MADFHEMTPPLPGMEMPEDALPHSNYDGTLYALRRAEEVLTGGQYREVETVTVVGDLL